MDANGNDVRRFVVNGTLKPNTVGAGGKVGTWVVFDGAWLDDLREYEERTCRDVHKEGFFECSSCNCTVQLMCDSDPTIFAGRAIIPNYCPNCGAKVVDDD